MTIAHTIKRRMIRPPSKSSNSIRASASGVVAFPTQLIRKKAPTEADASQTPAKQPRQLRDVACDAGVKSICWDLTFIRATDRKDNEAVQRNHPTRRSMSRAMRSPRRLKLPRRSSTKRPRGSQPLGTWGPDACGGARPQASSPSPRAMA